MCLQKFARVGFEPIPVRKQNCQACSYRKKGSSFLVPLEKKLSQPKLRSSFGTGLAVQRSGAL